MAAYSVPAHACRILASALSVIATTGCGGAQNSAAAYSNGNSVACVAPRCVTRTPDPVETRVRYGFACRGDVDSASSYSQPAPIAYLVTDRQRPGCPRLTKHESEIVLRYARDKNAQRTLRLACFLLTTATPEKSSSYLTIPHRLAEDRSVVSKFSTAGATTFPDPTYDPYRTRPGSGCLGPSDNPSRQLQR